MGFNSGFKGLSISSGQSLWCSVTGNRSFWGVQQIRCFPLPDRAGLQNVVLSWKMTENLQRKKVPFVIRCTSLDKIVIPDCTAISVCSVAVCYTAVCDVHTSLSVSLSLSLSLSSLRRGTVTVESNTRRRIFIVFVSVLCFLIVRVKL